MSSAQATQRRARHPYVARKKGTCGGKPVIKGTRIKIAQVAIEYDRMAMSPDEIIQAHPHLTLAQVHDALSYYYENAQEINEDIRADRESTAEAARVEPKVVGRYVVTAPMICHGEPTFRGTRIMVSQVLEQVASGMDWEAICEEWRGAIGKDAIGEAVRLASQVFAEHMDDLHLPKSRR